MADPTLKDVLKAIAEIRSEMATKSELATTKKEMNGRFDQVDRRFDQVDRRFEQVDRRFEQVDRRFEEVDRRFDRVDGAIAALDEDIEKHMKVHRELERDVAALKGRPVRTAARARRGSRRPAK